MPLSHQLAAAVCVAASLVMLAQARGRASRLGHIAMVAAMAVAAVAMQSNGLTWACALVLALVGALLWRRHADRDARACAVDVVAGAALLAVMGLSATLWPTTDHASMGMSVTPSVGGVPAAWPLLLAIVLLAVWVRARRALRDPRARPVAVVAPWTMMVAMLAMVVT